MTPVESLLAALRQAPYPGVWFTLELSATFLSCVCFLRHTRDLPELRRCFALALPFGLAGALALGALFRFIDFVAFAGPKDFSGVSAFGALLGLAAAYAEFVRRRGFRVRAALDRLAPAGLVLVGVGRVGCFAVGCDAGAVTSLPWAIRFPSGSQTFRAQVARGLVLPSDHHSLAVHPTQLYEVLIVLPTALLLSAALRRRHTPGRIFFVAALVYCLARIGVDALRPSHAVNYGQWAAGLTFVALLVAFRPGPREGLEGQLNGHSAGSPR